MYWKHLNVYDYIIIEVSNLLFILIIVVIFLKSFNKDYANRNEIKKILKICRFIYR